jgi:hypothetical protein
MYISSFEKIFLSITELPIVDSVFRDEQLDRQLSLSFFFFLFRNYMNDSLRTDIFLRFTPETIACACIDLAARTLQVREIRLINKFFIE